MSKPVNVYSISEVSQTLNENLPDVLARLGYTETFELVDQKLLIGYSVAIVAAVSFVIDKQFVHKDIVKYQQYLVGIYCILSVIFWYFKKYVEKAVVYSGKNDTETIKVKTSYEDSKPLYTVTLIDKKKKTLVSTLEINKVFNKEGYLQSELFLEWIKQQLATLSSKRQ
ncbi:similar to Saccharomyces cerevisiae YML055W SPC2 Subunit of signal peptidase complex [Maudiozyma saulgeensis]|uniref:Signal peptidase complex subunit 2 n=1 Tax=Maudiozyma saulgeensis TaxID=1789683 RepID=A0A1X7QZ80_9SACH|nr:similar to Saccharomyces cerevisiae YML055W SPC2 Subunit of signal peptidase complex [Kazachstania saulgeensis]